MYRLSTLAKMAKTRKIQVTLEESQYEKLAEIAERDGKKLAAVVRESIGRYCLDPELKKAKQAALKALLAVSAAAPEEYSSWEQEYAALKTETKNSKTGEPKGH
jgi:predicted DNA-binding protein